MFELVKTFTGEEILYDDVDHKYTTTSGVPMVSGSQFAHQYENEFDVIAESEKFAMKWGVDAEIVRTLWKNNSNVSTGFGTALHLGLETFYKFHREVEHITKKDYHYALPSNPTMRNIIEQHIETFGIPEKCHQEIFVSDVDSLLVGQVDFLDEKSKKCYIIADHKTVYDIHRKHTLNFPYNYVDTTLKFYFMQLSFYGHILTKKGNTILGIEIRNWNGKKWEKFISNPYTLMI